jgi:hypothetical protein
VNDDFTELTLSVAGDNPQKFPPVKLTRIYEELR